MNDYKITYDVILHNVVEIQADCIEHALETFYEKHGSTKVISVIQYYLQLGIF